MVFSRTLYVDIISISAWKPELDSLLCNRALQRAVAFRDGFQSFILFLPQAPNYPGLILSYRMDYSIKYFFGYAGKSVYNLPFTVCLITIILFLFFSFSFSLNIFIPLSLFAYLRITHFLDLSCLFASVSCCISVCDSVCLSIICLFVFEHLLIFFPFCRSVIVFYFLSLLLCVRCLFSFFLSLWSFLFLHFVFCISAPFYSYFV